MAVEPINIRLTLPEVLKVLQWCWRTLISSLCLPSYQINTGFGKVTNAVYALTRSQFVMAQQARSLIALDYNFESGLSSLLTIRLHQPADVSVVRDGLRDARNRVLHRWDSILVRKGKINNFFCRLRRVKISTKSLKRRAELLSHLNGRNGSRFAPKT